MGIIKVIEVLGYSEKGWEEAAQAMVTEAGKTIKGIESIYINEMSAKVDDGKITQYRINGKVSFRVRS